MQAVFSCGMGDSESTQSPGQAPWFQSVPPGRWAVLSSVKGHVLPGSGFMHTASPAPALCTSETSPPFPVQTFSFQEPQQRLRNCSSGKPQ